MPSQALKKKPTPQSKTFEEWLRVARPDLIKLVDESLNKGLLYCLIEYLADEDWSKRKN